VRIELANEEAPALGPTEPLRRTTPRPARKPKSKLKTWYLKQLHTWHWVSAAISLVGMLLFAITGITLNHAGAISANPSVTQRNGDLPPALLRLMARPDAEDSPLPAPVAAGVRDVVGIDVAQKAGEWSDSEVYVSAPRPGGDAWVTIDRASGHMVAEITDRGWISYLNDLHKGRNAGSTWFWFIDLFAVACVIFTITGLLLLQLHARNRRSTWPLVAAGLIIPGLIALLFIH
jgi:uncharacterized protein